MSLPLQHVAIIMDGNGRWARKRAMPHLYGHRKGIDALKRVCGAAIDLKIPYLTVYAFSTENWNRPVEEVTGILNLLEEYLIKDLQEFQEKGIRLTIMGDLTAFSQKLQKLIQETIEETKNNTSLNLCVALNYGSRLEIIKAVQKIAQESKDGSLDPLKITETTITQHLWNYPFPDPDLIIRTSGEQRLSNFLLWQAAYAELYFTPVLWPDFKQEHFREAINFYQQRDRRYGKLSSNLT